MKKIAVLICVCLIWTTIVPSTMAQMTVEADEQAFVTSVACGDVNADGVVNATDVSNLTQKLAGWDVGVREEACDVNNDGQVNATDVATLMQNVAGWNEDLQPDTGEGDLIASGSATVNPSTDGNVTQESTMIDANTASAEVPAGVMLKNGTTELALSVSALNESGSDVQAGDNEKLSAFDVNVAGVSEENNVPIIVTIDSIVDNGFNKGNIKLYHVEKDGTKEMTEVESVEDLSEHNQFAYDETEGTISLALANFSEVAVVTDTQNVWNGNVNENFAGSGTENDPYIIANADQLAGLGKLVAGGNNFEGETVKLINDVNMGGETVLKDGKLQFYPIGYTSEGFKGEFSGTFDGAGHTVSNIFQNTWMLLGTYSGTYYNAAMGLFGYVYNGTIKNLTVDNFQSDGEFATTGCVAAYAAGNATFENIAITNCNPRVYNTGNGGIVGIGGSTGDEDTVKLTFKNITIDNTNKITALWGSWDVACGGLVGMFRGPGSVEMTNCHVAAQIDVYNDVCGNYQYYWYRYSGMLIGTNKNMITDEEGYTRPDTSKFTAENCTVHFDVWNDYYYCEIVDNSLASYTHDHQFSRLIQVDNVDTANKTYTVNGKTEAVPASGRANYVVVNGEASTENATCYHFKNGEIWNHEDAGYETTDIDGDGEIDSNVLKEDKQHVYLPFNQLFTGYGWGVKHIPIYDNENDNVFDGVTILDRDVADSVDKFESADNAADTYYTDTTVTVGEIFKAVETSGVEIDADNVQVFVSPVGETSTAGATYVANEKDWTQGTLTFKGTGAATISITDYNYCNIFTVPVTVTERVLQEKFTKKFDKDFLYRLGNKNAVVLGDLFSAADDAKDATVSVACEVVKGNASMNYNPDTSNWENGTVKFTGTGVVKITITDNDYCIPTDLYLEIIEATNLTNAQGTTTGGDFVLVKDINTSTYQNYWNSTVYGNGFTYSLNGAPTAYNSKQGHGILITKNAVLDNLVIVGDIYDSYGAYTNQNYYNAAIDVVEETIIRNCYISHCAAPVSTRANTTIINTTLYGGTVANLIIKGGTVTTENITTVNYDDGRSLVGMGIVAHADVAENARLILNGTLKQYNFMSEKKVPTDTYAQQIHNTMFGSSVKSYHFGEAPDRYVNSGIVSLSDSFTIDNVTDNANTGYAHTNVSLGGKNGFVYSQKNTWGSVDNNYNAESDTHIATTYGAVPPAYNFDYETKNYVAKTDGSNDYCYLENGIVKISMDAGDTFTWDTSILTATKNGHTLAYTVSMNGVDYTGKSIVFSEQGDYEVEYSYTDTNNYKMDANGNLTTYSVTYTQVVDISVFVVAKAAKNAEFTFGSSNTASKTVTIGNYTYVMPDVNATSSTIGSTTVSGTTVYYPIVEIIMSDGKTSHTSGWYAYFPVLSGVVTITDYPDDGKSEEAVVYNGSTTTMPDKLSVVGVPTTLFKYESGSQAGASPVVKNNILVYSSAKIEANRKEYNTVIQYIYTDNKGTTYYYYVGYHAPAQSYSNTCITPETLITLADGTQKQVQHLTGEEMLLVWNHETGMMESAPIAYIYNYDGAESEHEIITLCFEDGKEIEIVYEHVFFDADLNKYVALGDNAQDYIGHSFAVVTDGKLTTTELVGIRRETRTTAVYEVVTHGTVTCFTADILSASAYLEKLLNHFDIDASTMKYVNVSEDIEKYGLYTYADFEGIISEQAFELYNAKYLKIAIGKGYITWDDILGLVDIYKDLGIVPRS